MKDTAPLIELCITMLGLAALAILYTNWRLDILNARGAPTLQTESIVFLAGCAALVIVSARWFGGPRGYILSPLAALVIVAAYFIGTARFD